MNFLFVAQRTSKTHLKSHPVLRPIQSLNRHYFRLCMTLYLIYFLEQLSAKMSNESWTVYTIKFIGWIALRAAADYMISGLRDALNFAEVVKNLYHGDIVGGVINLLYGVVCYGTVGALSVVKDVAGQSIKEVVVHGTKRISLTNEAGKGLVSSDFAKEKVQLKRSVITVKF